MTETIRSRYRIEVPIGGGGMAVVYRGTDLLLGRPIAVKRMRPEFRGDTALVRRFYREAQAAACIVHPNIVTLYDVGEDEDGPYIIMEYVEGETLKALIEREAPLPPERIVAVGADILDALETAHRAGIVHRDIKPHNILLDRTGRVKVTDFGIARAVTQETLTDDRTFGSVPYFSPEQARGGVVGPASDLYSLGVVLFEMATGRLPFDGEDPVAVALKHVSAPPPSPRELNPALPGGLANVILRALAKHPEDRHPDAAAMRRDLLTALRPERRDEPPIGDPAGRWADEETIAFRPLPAVPAAARKGATPANRPEADGLNEGGGVRPGPGERRGSFSENDGRTPGGSPPVRAEGLLPEADTPPGEGGRPEGSRPPAEGDGDPGAPGAAPPDRRRRWLFAGTGALLVLLLLVVLGRAIAGALIVPEVEVPNVTGQDRAAAEAALNALGLVPAFDERFNDEAPAGQVIAQTPAAGERAKRGTPVELIVSLGPRTVVMPSVVGLSREAAEAELKDFSSITVTEAYDDEAPKGTVIRQTPAAGDRVVPQKTAVELVVSLGRRYFDMPDLVGLTKEEAESLLLKHDLVLKAIREEPSYFPKGRVFAQWPVKPGETVTAGQEITLFVSSGLKSDARVVEYPVSVLPASGQATTVNILLRDARTPSGRVVVQETVTGPKEYTVEVVVAPGRDGTIEVYENGVLTRQKIIRYADVEAPAAPPSSEGGSGMGADGGGEAGGSDPDRGPTGNVGPGGDRNLARKWARQAYFFWWRVQTAWADAGGER
ncbi:MAG: Stk1 family PASTA domain-containing Ser/Thr kinase [Hydrogenibacillus schlegelii]|uniref:non-specific serine/threonine protein kinase n=1 Tax=Hydrogenibacillus schlegelii TaxID=1484 RepID=A0A947CYP2_HYDSH|nr:Stk1 family PASTA domain-containing Ser/Thr kinase [Hydrogenibacillus schlegelii]